MTSQIILARNKLLAKKPVRRYIRRHAAELKKLLTVVIFYIVGIFYYGNAEDWSVSECIYYTTVSITTVGYGVSCLHYLTMNNAMHNILRVILGRIMLLQKTTLKFSLFFMCSLGYW